MSRPAPNAHDETEASGPRRRSSRESQPSLEIELDGLRATGEHFPELPALRRFAGYEILGRIAVGGMAEVFLARERAEAGSARHVALKVIRAQLAADPGFAEMFVREGKLALGIRHPNVCHTYRFGMEHGHPFLAMELVAGVTVRELASRARRAGRSLPAPVAIKIASSVAEALHSAHVARDERGRSLGIVHQDVSPHNVMVAYDGTVKLLDFGVASTSTERALDSADASHTTIRGKVGYLSPEQCTGASVDARSDVFSLGVVLYEMLAGARLFSRPRRLDSMRAIATEPLPAWPESIPRALQPVLERALARDPDERYPTAEALQSDLERVLAESRIAVTSARIAEELARILGDDVGRPPRIDTSREVVAWLRAPDDDASEVAIPLVARRARFPALGAVAIGVGALGVAAVIALVAHAMMGAAGAPEAGAHVADDRPRAASTSARAPDGAELAPVAGASGPEETAAAVHDAHAIDDRATRDPRPRGEGAARDPRASAIASRPGAAPRRAAGAADPPASTRARPRPRVRAPAEITPGDFVDDPGF